MQNSPAIIIIIIIITARCITNSIVSQSSEVFFSPQSTNEVVLYTEQTSYICPVFHGVARDSFQTKDSILHLQGKIGYANSFPTVVPQVHVTLKKKRYLILKVLHYRLHATRYMTGTEQEPHSFQVKRTTHWTTRALQT